MKKGMTTAVTVAALLSSSILPSVTYAAETESQSHSSESTDLSTTESSSTDEQDSTDEDKDADKKAEEKKKKEEAEKKAAEEKKKKEEEAKKKAEEEKKKKEEAEKKAEEDKKKEEADKKADEDEKKEDADKKDDEKDEDKDSESSSSSSHESSSSSSNHESSSSSHHSTSSSHTSSSQSSHSSSTSTTSSTHHKKPSSHQTTTDSKKPKPQKSHYRPAKATSVKKKAGQTGRVTNDAVSNALPVVGVPGEVNDDPLKITTNITGEKFVKLVGKYAAKIAAENDLYASVMIAQACLESGFGSSMLSQVPYYNFFGIKGSYKGKSVNMQTLEDGAGGMYSINAGFRAYPKPEDSLKDYAKLLQQPMYKGARKSKTNSYKDATRYLTGRYATDRNYASKLNGIIEAYDLTEYDNYKGSDIKRMKRVKIMENLYYTVKIGDILSQIAQNNDTTVRDIQKWNKKKITDVNLIFPNQKLIVGKKVTYKNVKVDGDDSDAVVDAKQGDFNMPLKPGTYTVTSPYGNRGSEHHDGIDLATPTNSNVYAAKDGIVMATGFDPSAGNYIFVYHGNGIYTNYFHLNKVNVELGDSVKAGHCIAKSGSTGNSTGPHLHFGVSKRIWGDYMNPAKYLDF